ncbi:MAG: fabH [Herbinix sp.]|jgi:3-oxoacyl-[acyl-carrier-protein] synthase-3|nr:fabH [Herbinix sp.]
MRHATIIGTGSYAPDNTMTNEDLTKLVDTNDEWIITRTGIKERRIATGELTSDLAYEAAVRAIQNAGLTAAEIDLIICATITPDSFMPSVACIVQDRLKAMKAAAFDLTAACTGMIYGMVTAAQFIETGMYQNILVIGAETLSKILNWEDRSTCVLFGDGAGAVVVSSTEKESGMLSSNLLSDGSKQALLSCPAVPLNNPFTKAETTNFAPSITMQGQEVFKFAVRSITENVKAVLKKANHTVEDIKYIIPHQANLRIIEQAAKFLDVPVDKFYLNLEHYGNTSAASIGIALDELVQNKQIQHGDKLILVGFGGGMTSGAVLLEWD